jgi:hypothetical protein
MPSQAKTAARGYGNHHQRERAKWEPLVEAGQVDCHAKLCLMPTRWIEPGSIWHLGHTEDRTTWTGPEHPRCNCTEAAIRRHAMRNSRRHPRRWVF